MVAETREIAGALAAALMDIPLDALGICTDKTMRKIDAALARAKAAGIASSPTKPPQAALPPSK